MLLKPSLTSWRIAVLGLAVLLPGMAVAQQRFVSAPVDNSLARNRSIVRRLVTQPTRTAEQDQQIQDFFDKYFFPAMAQATPEGLGQISGLRDDLFLRYLPSATPQIQTRLTEKTYKFVLGVLRGRYHPSVKYNAVLSLGMLGASYPSQGAEPLPQATKLLCQIADYAAEKKVPPYMQAAALIGMEKHARYYDKLPAEGQESLLNSLGRSVSVEAVAAAPDPAVRDWLRRRAALGLVLIARFDKAEPIAGLLLKLVADDSLTLETRCEVAAAFKNLPSPADAAGVVLKTTLAVMAYEAEQAELFREKTIEGVRRGDERSIQSDRFRYDSQSSSIVLIREGLIVQITRLQTALGAVADAAGPKSEAIQAVIEDLSGLIALAKDKNAIDVDVTTEVLAINRALIAATSDAPPPAESAAEEVAPVEEAEPEEESLF